jgi:hypothetical protein
LSLAPSLSSVTKDERRWCEEKNCQTNKVSDSLEVNDVWENGVNAEGERQCNDEKSTAGEKGKETPRLHKSWCPLDTSSAPFHQPNQLCRTPAFRSGGVCGFHPALLISATDGIYRLAGYPSGGSFRGLVDVCWGKRGAQGLCWSEHC